MHKYLLAALIGIGFIILVCGFSLGLITLLAYYPMPTAIVFILCLGTFMGIAIAKEEGFLD